MKRIPPSLDLFLYEDFVEVAQEQEATKMKRAVTLKKNYEFQRIFHKGTSAVSNCMVLYCRKNHLGRNRLGLVSSTKLGKAVVRNRTRRRLREVYRLHKGQLKQGYDLILVGRGRTSSVPWSELNVQFEKLCQKLDLLEKMP